MYKVCYMRPRKGWKPGQPLLEYAVATYKVETEEEAIAKFHKYHDGKGHNFSHAWREDPIDKLRRELGRMLLPRR